MKIQDMPAGPEMDRLVAEKVMGWEPAFLNEDGTPQWDMGVIGRYLTSRFYPSKNIAHAWHVVERVTDIRLPRRPDGFPPSTVFMYHFQKANLWAMSSEDAAAEICRAALLAVGREVAP